VVAPCPDPRTLVLHPPSSGLVFPPPPPTRSSLLRLNFPEIMWFVGFYTRKGDSEVLEIGPYQGLMLACGTIQWGKGVCGTAAASGVTQIVDDVSKIDNYVRGGGGGVCGVCGVCARCIYWVHTWPNARCRVHA
jgi:hypothetical protein